jgi:pimeloyl-ACP methyl ester carboxylesterase
VSITRLRLLIPDERKPRGIAVSLHGQNSNDPLVLALPGLLETQESFQGLVDSLCRRHRVLTFDWVGRGQSDWLEDSSRYRMSLYLKDLGLIYAFAQGLLNGSSQACNQVSSAGPQATAGIVMVGTSMGGLVALAFAGLRPGGLRKIVLNDVGSLLPWTGILGLMTGLHGTTKTAGLFSNPHDLAKDLRVDPRLIRAVQKPGHLDLPYEATLSGVDFSASFRAVSEPILVLRAGESEMVDDRALAQLEAGHIRLENFQQAGHPVPYNESSCKVIKDFLRS